MNEKESKTLTEFPQVFKSCFDFSPSKGWEDIVYNLTKELLAIWPSLNVAQVKEKFGGLSYYIGVYRDLTDDTKKQVDGLISAAEHKSRETCEFCGGPGKEGEVGSWWVTACDKCLKEAHERKAQSDHEREERRKRREKRRDQNITDRPDDRIH